MKETAPESSNFIGSFQINLELLLTNIRALVPLSDEEALELASIVVPEKLGKRDILLSKDETSKHMRFIKKGCLRNYYLDSAGHEHVLQFGIEGWWVNDLHSYITQTPAQSYIQALEPSEVLQLPRKELLRLFDRIPTLERFFRIKMQSAYAALQERTVHSMSKTADQRYLDFRKKYRAIEQRVPQYMVASYLGITPEHLSSLRKNLAQELS